MKQFFAFALLAAYAATAAPIDDIGALRVVGNQVVGANGQPAQLMGMSLYHGQHKAGRDFVNRSVITSLAQDWRSSVVRIPMMYESEGGTGGGQGYNTNPTASMAMVDSVVQAAIDLGIYVVIDWHEVNTIGHQSEATQFFTTMSQRWGSYPNVIYEVFNEPTSSSWATIKSYATAVIGAIRANDPDNLIVVGTRTWSQEVNEASKSPISGTNIAYTLHFYASETGHQGLRAKADSAMATAGGSTGIALFATEWGNSAASGGGALNTTYMNSFMSWMLTKKLSWCNWSLSDIPESSAALLNGSWNAQGLITHVVPTTGDWTDAQLSESGRFVRNTILANRPAWTAPLPPTPVRLNQQPANTPQLTRHDGQMFVHLNAGHTFNRVKILDVRGKLLASYSVAPQQTSIALPNLGQSSKLFIELQGRDSRKTIVTE